MSIYVSNTYIGYKKYQENLDVLYFIAHISKLFTFTKLTTQNFHEILYEYPCQGVRELA